MIRILATSLALAALMGGAALAETFEVQMLNKGDCCINRLMPPWSVAAVQDYAAANSL
ncbi:MAG: hypothetical protein ABJO27_21880 [Pseudoruegeria sp.]